MPIEFSILPEAHLIVARFHGELTIDELRDYNLRLRAHGDFHAEMHELITVEGIRPRMDYQHLAEYREWFLEQKPLPVTAIVAADELAFGLARQFVTLANHDDAQMHVFRDEGEARVWLSAQRSTR